MDTEDYDDDYDEDEDYAAYEETDDDFDEVVDDITTMDINREKNFKILKAEDIRKRLEADIVKVSLILCVSREAAMILLCNYRWDVNRINEEWFADEDKVRKASGLLTDNNKKDYSFSGKQFFCGICLEDHNYLDFAVGVGCGHIFCKTCWIDYVRISIHDGRGCLMMRCPELKCGAVVGQDLIFSLASDEDKERYDGYLIRSYVEDRKQTKWCPAPGCDCAVDYVLESSTCNGGRNFDVVCSCSYGFCWNCLEEAHSPVNCDTTANWIVKYSSEGENMTWLLAYTKPCPECKKPIEKNKGCMHMTCKAPCKFEFCWLCLGAWSEHGSGTGGFYSCNIYTAAKESGEYSEEKSKRKMAKYSIKKYTHYSERWASNHSSRQKALDDLQEMENKHLEKLSEIQGEPVTALEFISDAWVQVVECRRVLKWTYAYGYYIPENQRAKKQLFECLQGEAEAALERLHECVENELKKYYLVDTGPSKEFSDFRQKLVNLTGVTRNFFSNLVRAFGNDLLDDS